jgi:glycosyltransferase involved in cell wall biosynthesis
MTAVAIAHDYLTQTGGAERVALTLGQSFPDAPIHTTVWSAADCYPEFAELDIRTTALDAVPLFRRDPRWAFPLLAPTVSRIRIDADVVICSTSGWAHGVATDGRRLIYCHSPARWLYRRDDYDVRTRVAGRMASRLLGPPLRRWDRRAARRADRYLANSTVTAQAIRSAYGIDAEILHPPVSLDQDGASTAVPGLDPGFVLCISRNRGYKNVEAVVAAANRHRFPQREVVVVGGTADGGTADGGVRRLGRVDDATLRWLYQNAELLVAAAREDFGLTPVEAAAAGIPTVALRQGGYLDTVVDGETGFFFEEPEPDAIASAVRLAMGHRWDPATIRTHARRFDRDHFIREIRRHVSELDA